MVLGRNCVLGCYHNPIVCNCDNNTYKYPILVLHLLNHSLLLSNQVFYQELLPKCFLKVLRFPLYENIHIQLYNLLDFLIFHDNNYLNEILVDLIYIDFHLNHLFEILYNFHLVFLEHQMLNHSVNVL